MSEVVATSKSGMYKLEKSFINAKYREPYWLFEIIGTEIINEYNGRHLYNCGGERYINKIWKKRYFES